MPPIASDGRPDAQQQLIAGIALYLRGDVVIVGIDVAFVAAQRLAVQKCVRVTIGGVEFEAHAAAGHLPWNAEALAVPPLLVADPIGIVRAEPGRVQPLYVRAAGHADLAPLRRGPAAFLAPSQFPLAIQREGGRIERRRIRFSLRASITVLSACRCGNVKAISVRPPAPVASKRREPMPVQSSLPSRITMPSAT